jgi:hypothetical protein
MTATRPGLKSRVATGWRRSWTSRSFRLLRTSYLWLSLRETRSRTCGSGLRVGACRRVGRACIRRRKVAVVVGSGVRSGRIEAGLKTQGGESLLWRPAPLAFESPWPVRRQARLRRRNIVYPPQARPARAMAQVEGSGTATGLAKRKPKYPPPPEFPSGSPPGPDNLTRYPLAPMIEAA